MQQMFSPNSGIVAGGNFNIDNRGPTGRMARSGRQYYQNVIRYLVDVIDQTKADPKRANLYNMARIWKAYAFQVLTDSVW